MGIPIFVAAGTQAQTANGGGTGPVTPGIPAGATTDDILVLYIETANEPVSATSGYADIGVGTVAQANGLVTALTIRWKRAGGSESAPSVSIAAGNHVIARLVAFRGCVTTGNPYESVQVSTDNTTVTTATIQSAAAGTLGPDRMICAAVATGTDVTSTTMAGTWTNASLASPGITESLDNWHVTGNGGGFASAYGGKAAQGTYNNTTAVLTTGNTKAMMSFALIGASAAAGPVQPKQLNYRSAVNRSYTW